MTDQDKPELKPWQQSSEACFDPLKAPVEEELAVSLAFDDDHPHGRSRGAFGTHLLTLFLTYSRCGQKIRPRYRWKPNPRSGTLFGPRFTAWDRVAMTHCCRL